MSVAELPMSVVTPPPRPATRPASPPDPYETAPTDTKFEVIDGKVVEKPMSVLEQYIAGLLQEYVAPFVRQAGIGRAVVEMKFRVPGSRNDRQPDTAFVSFERWPRDRPIPQTNAWPVAPDLVVEVVSPTNEAFEVIGKVAEYFAGGVRAVWLVWSNVGQVYCYDSPTSVRILTTADVLTGDPIVPGLRMPVADLFPPSEPAP